MRPVALIIAGPNGSGKSTLIRQLMNDPVFSFPHNYINADDIERELPADGAVTKGERERLHLRRPEDGDNNIGRFGIHALTMRTWRFGSE